MSFLEVLNLPLTFLVRRGSRLLYTICSIFFGKQVFKLNRDSYLCEAGVWTKLVLDLSTVHLVEESSCRSAYLLRFRKRRMQMRECAN
jgi:hypothetical protein